MNKRTKIILTLILLCFLLRGSYVYFFTTPDQYIMSDMGVYDGSAESILKNEFNILTPLWSPAYSLFVSGVYYGFQILGIHQHKFVLMALFNVLFGALSLFFVYAITEKLAAQKQAIIASFIYIVFYPLIYYNAFNLTENIFSPLLLASMYIIICRLKTRNKAWFILLGLILGWATSIRPSLAFFPPLFMLWYWRYNKPFSHVLISMGLVAVFFFIVVGAHIAFTHSITNGEVTSLSASGGANFALAWCDLELLRHSGEGYSYSYVPVGHLTNTPKHNIKTDVPFTNQKYYYQMGLDCIKKQPMILVYNFKHITDLFHGNLFPNFYNIKGHNWLFIIFKIFTYFLLLPFSVFAYYIVKKRISKISDSVFLVINLFICYDLCANSWRRTIFTPLFIHFYYIR